MHIVIKVHCPLKVAAGSLSDYGDDISEMQMFWVFSRYLYLSDLLGNMFENMLRYLLLMDVGCSILN